MTWLRLADRESVLLLNAAAKPPQFQREHHRKQVIDRGWKKTRKPFCHTRPAYKCATTQNVRNVILQDTVVVRHRVKRTSSWTGPTFLCHTHPVDKCIERMCWWQNISFSNKTMCNTLIWVLVHKNWYIPFISRVRGPYGKLWTKFFPLPFMAQARSAWAMKTRKEKNEDP